MKEGNRSRLASSVSRRAFLGSSAAAAAGCLIAGSRGAEAIPAVTAVKTASEARVRTDLLDEKSPPGLEVVQLTADASVPASHLYIEARPMGP